MILVLISSIVFNKNAYNYLTMIFYGVTMVTIPLHR